MRCSFCWTTEGEIFELSIRGVFACLGGVGCEQRRKARNLALGWVK